MKTGKQSSSEIPVLCNNCGKDSTFSGIRKKVRNTVQKKKPISEADCESYHPETFSTGLHSKISTLLQ